MQQAVEVAYDDIRLTTYGVVPLSSLVTWRFCVNGIIVSSALETLCSVINTDQQNPLIYCLELLPFCTKITLYVSSVTSICIFHVNYAIRFVPRNLLEVLYFDPVIMTWESHCSGSKLRKNNGGWKKC